LFCVPARRPLIDPNREAAHPPDEGDTRGFVMSNLPIDPTRLAAAILLEEVSTRSAALANLLRSGESLPPIMVGLLLVDANKMQGRLTRHADRLRPEGGDHQ
jgi:hypothetical protein